MEMCHWWSLTWTIFSIRCTIAKELLHLFVANITKHFYLYFRFPFAEVSRGIHWRNNFAIADWGPPHNALGYETGASSETPFHASPSHRPLCSVYALCALSRRWQHGCPEAWIITIADRQQVTVAPVNRTEWDMGPHPQLELKIVQLLINNRGGIISNLYIYKL